MSLQSAWHERLSRSRKDIQAERRMAKEWAIRSQAKEVRKIFEMVMATTDEQIYQLVKQYRATYETATTNQALRQIAFISGCISQIPKQLTEQQHECVLKWLKANYPNAYLWAIGQSCFGHPAVAWGLSKGSFRN